MTIYAVAFTVWLCPGVMTVLGFSIPLARLPDSAKPALGALGVCEARPAVELYDPAQAGEARARVRALGKPAQMFVCTYATCGEPAVAWTTTPTFKETTP